MAERILTEDALKHCYDCEYAGLPATTTSLAGALEIRRDQAVRLLQRLEAMGLVDVQQRTLRLTAEGRAYALRVIRTHRLWESYLADRTGVDESQWHYAADQKEHTLTDAEVEDLSTRLGDPAFDPHGDPIPRADGSMPNRRGTPLSDMEAGESARVIQMGDKPAAIYDQLVAARLFPGVTLLVLENGPDRIRISAHFREYVLAPVVAANLTVEPIAKPQAARVPDARLSSLRVGQEASVLDISPACRGLERRRLLDLGIVPGTKIEVELSSISGDPIAYRVRGALIALRSEQAELIHVIWKPTNSADPLMEDESSLVGPTS